MWHWTGNRYTGRPMTTIGLLGGGYLSRLTAQAAQRLGTYVAVLDKDELSPAMQITAFGVEGDWSDLELAADFAGACDVVIAESTQVPAATLAHLETLGRIVRPSSATQILLQDRLAFKQWLSGHGIAVAPHAAIASRDEARAFMARHPLSGAVLKRRGGPGAGKASALAKSANDVDRAFDHLAKEGAALMIEQHQQGLRELSIVGARAADGACRTYPVATFRTAEGVVVSVNAPAEDRLATHLAEHGRRADAVYLDGVPALAKRIAGLLGIVGAFALELIEQWDGSVLVNSVAAGPTIQGLFTIDGAETSLFENHVRAALGLSLGWTDLLAPCVATATMLSRGDTLPGTYDYAAATQMRGGRLHWYGKNSAYRTRKLGHVTGLSETDPEAERIAQMTVVALLGW